MQFRLSTLFLLFLVLWSSLAVFGPGGIVVFGLCVVVAIGIARSWSVILWGLLLLLLLTLLMPSVQSAREAARRISCNNQMKEIALALHNYHQVNGCFPPAYVADKNGRPMHSWRVLILPYLDYDPLYKAYNFNEPWDGPNNKKLLAARPRVYACPSDEHARMQGATETSYVAVVGANAAWAGEKTRRFDDFHGAMSSTIMVVEVADAGINWSEPKDLSLDALEAAGERPSTLTVSSKHGTRNDFFYTYRYDSGSNVTLADGSVRYIPPECLAPNVLPEYLRIGGCKEFEFDNDKYTPPSWSGERHLNWGNCIALAIWIASVALLLFRAIQSRKTLAVKGAEEGTGEGTTDGHGSTRIEAGQ